MDAASKRWAGSGLWLGRRCKMPRPATQITEEQRRLVRSLSAFGVPQDQIAARIGIRSAKTLRKHYREDLDRGALDANATVSQTLFKLASSGTCPVATIFWLKIRAGWTERPQFERTARELPPFI